MKYLLSVFVTVAALVNAQEMIKTENKQLFLKDSHKLKLSTSGFEDIFVGVLIGLADGNGFDADFACVNDLYSQAEEFDNYIAILQEDGISSAEKSLKGMGNIVYQVGEDFINCGLDTTNEEIIKDVLDALVKFADPAASAFVNLAWNWYSIYEEVSDAINDWNNGDLESFG